MEWQCAQFAVCVCVMICVVTSIWLFIWRSDRQYGFAAQRCHATNDGNSYQRSICFLCLPAEVVLSAGVTSYALTNGDISKYNPVWTELDCSCVRECQYYMADRRNHHENNWHCPRWAGGLVTPLCLFTTKEYNQYTVNHHTSLGAFT
jgi:hypothetical protein